MDFDVSDVEARLLADGWEADAERKGSFSRSLGPHVIRKMNEVRKERERNSLLHRLYAWVSSLFGEPEICWSELSEEETLIVWRVENNDGKGPYCSGVGEELSHHECCDRPSPWRDGPIAIAALGRDYLDDLWEGEWQWQKFIHCKQDQGRTMICGFPSLERLREWFDGYDRDILIRKGFYVAVYSVLKTEAFVSEDRVIFSREHSKFLDAIEL